MSPLARLSPGASRTPRVPGHPVRVLRIHLAHACHRSRGPRRSPDCRCRREAPASLIGRSPGRRPLLQRRPVLPPLQPICDPVPPLRQPVQRGQPRGPVPWPRWWALRLRRDQQWPPGRSPTRPAQRGRSPASHRHEWAQLLHEDISNAADLSEDFHIGEGTVVRAPLDDPLSQDRTNAG